MKFLTRLSLTLVSSIAGWIAGNVVWFGVGLFQGSAQDRIVWFHNIGQMTLAGWLLFGVPVSVLDERRSGFQRWWTAALAGGLWGLVAIAVYMHWLVRYPLSGFVWVFLVKIYATAFTIGSVSLGLYYSIARARGSDTIE